jgi:hypothetical protein
MDKKTKTDPMARSLRKAYRGTAVYRLDQLLAEESRWKRKVTIATNKLADVRAEINAFAQVLAGATLGADMLPADVPSPAAEGGTDAKS